MSSPSTAIAGYNSLQTLLTNLGLTEKLSKACPPSTTQTVLGILIDTVSMTLSVTPERLNEIHELLKLWLTKKSATKRELQSLVGKLSFVTKCVRQSRIFLNRLLTLLRSVKSNHHFVRLTQEFRKDLFWWQEFVNVYNGVSLIPRITWSSPDAIFATDSCLTGCGGVNATSFFHSPYPQSILDLNLPIHCLELLAVTVAVKLWGSSYGGMKVQIYCDNSAVVSVLNSSKTKDQFLASCLRKLWFYVSFYEFEIRAVHLSGTDNRLPDLLSRWHINNDFSNLFYKANNDLKLVESFVTDSIFSFNNLF